MAKTRTAKPKAELKPGTNKVPLTVWQRPGVSQQVDDYWTGSPDEAAHRVRLAKLVVAHMATPGDSILEVGCGSGLVYGALLAETQRAAVYTGVDLNYTGVDTSVEMLAIARKRYPGVLLGFDDAYHLSAKDNAYDIAIAFEVFGHLADNAKPIAELIRVAKRKAIFTIWLGGGNKAQAGADHYEYPLALIHENIEQACVGQHCIYESRGIGPVAAFAVIKGD